MHSCEKVFDRIGKEYRIGQRVHCRPDGSELFSVQENPQQLVLQTTCSIPEQNRLSCDSSSLMQVQVPVYDQDGQAFGFLMRLKRELPNPVSLEARLMQLGEEVSSSIPVRKLLAVQMCRIFSLVHQEGFVFGFAEPGDFLVSERNRLVCASTDRCLTNPVEWESMWYYCAPEVLAADANCEYDFAGDCYTLGILLFQILTGSYPFGGGLLPKEERILEEILDGKSVFFYSDRPENQSILARLREYDADGEMVSQTLLSLFQRTFDYSGSSSYQEGRPSLAEWAHFMQAAKW